MIEALQDRIKFNGAVKRVLNIKNPDVQLILRRLMKEANLMRPTFVAGKPDLSAFREGQRHIVCSLFSHVATDTDTLIAQLRELEHENPT